MARGLQIITPQDEPFSDEQINADDIIIVQPEGFESSSHDSNTNDSSDIIPARIEHEINATSSSSQNSGSATSSNATPSATNDFLSSLVNHVPCLDSLAQPSLEETRTAGQILFTQFVQQYMAQGTNNASSHLNLEIMEEAIPDEVPEDINRVMQ